MTATTSNDKHPTADPAEYDAFFPSPYSLSQFTSARSNLSDANYPSPYTGGRWKILMLCTDERYLQMDNGSFFSTGNHPVETLLPMYHLDKAGFSFDIATLSGNPVKFEYWAMPTEDIEVTGLFSKYHQHFKSPLKLADVLSTELGDNSDYLGIFIPGGHGALIGLPASIEVKNLLEWAIAHDKFIISLCHGPAAFLSVERSDLFAGYKICAFPDTLDAQTPEIGYMPGHLTWKFGEQLKSIGFEIVNTDISGATCRDRKMLTGDSPLAGNALGQLAAKALLSEVSKELRHAGK